MGQAKNIYLRLSIMIFLQIFIYGTVTPVISLYLTKILKLTGVQAGFILATPGVAMLITPLITTFVVDRMINVKYLLSFCQISAGVVMLLFRLQENFMFVFIFYFLYVLIIMPTTSLANAIIFQHVKDSSRNYGGIRLWGTIGWISSAWLFSYIWLKGFDDNLRLDRLPDALTLAAVTSIVYGFYVFTLPVVNKMKKEKLTKRNILPINAVRVFFKRNSFIAMLICLISYITFQYYFFGMGPYLLQSGFNEADIMPIMSLGQITEIISLLLLGQAIVRLKFKWTILIGVSFNVWRFSAFLIGNSKFIILSGILAHGVSDAFIFSAIFVFLDSQTVPDCRSSVQQIIGMVTYGLAATIGSFIAGNAMDAFKNADTELVNYRFFWFIPVILTFIAVILHVFGFKSLSSRVSKRNTEPLLNKS